MLGWGMPAFTSDDSWLELGEGTEEAKWVLVLPVPWMGGCPHLVLGQGCSWVVSLSSGHQG